MVVKERGCGSFGPDPLFGQPRGTHVLVVLKGDQKEHPPFWGGPQETAPPKKFGRTVEHNPRTHMNIGINHLACAASEHQARAAICAFGLFLLFGPWYVARLAHAAAV